MTKYFEVISTERNQFLVFFGISFVISDPDRDSVPSKCAFVSSFLWKAQSAACHSCAHPFSGHPVRFPTLPRMVCGLQGWGVQRNSGCRWLGSTAGISDYSARSKNRFPRWHQPTVSGFIVFLSDFWLRGGSPFSSAAASIVIVHAHFNFQIKFWESDMAMHPGCRIVRTHLSNCPGVFTTLSHLGNSLCFLG